MVRITESYERSPFEVPSQSLLKKQEFVLTVLSDGTKDRMQLIGTDLIFKLEHLYLRLRNFNIEIEFVRNNVPQSDDDLKKILDYIFLRNMRLALMAYKMRDHHRTLVPCDFPKHGHRQERQRRRD